MGYIRHNAILVTATYDVTSDQEAPEGVAPGTHWAEVAHEHACRLFGGVAPVTPVVDGVTNGTRSFAVLPDGSKEGWDASDAGDHSRQLFIKWLEARAYENGSSPFSWVELQYGDDEGDTKVLHHSDEPNGTECRPYPESTETADA